MFCPKCGSKALDGATFCQKCGAKLITDDIAQQTAVSTPVQQTQMPAYSVPLDMPKKKKLGKLPIILGAVFLAIVVIIVIAMNWEGKMDYEATVRAYMPYANSQGLSYTCGEVFDKYIPDAKWKIRKSGDVAYVDISGKAKETDNELVVTIKVAEDPSDPDLAKMTPEFVTIEGKKSPSQNDAVEFLLAMFLMYEEKYDDTSDLFSETGILSGTQTSVGKTQSYDNEHGNIEVTLDYVEFVDKLEDHWTGDDIYPDEGCVFLRAAVTVENIGTEKGGLITGWNKIVYDGQYEFVEYFHYTEDDLTNIKPLSPPKKGALIFTVSDSVVESDKSLVLNINDVSGKPLISYVLRPAGGTSDVIRPAAGMLGENGTGSSTEISAHDFVGTYSYDASFETPDGQYANFYYLLEIGEDGEDLVVTETWRGNYILDHIRVGPDNLTGNTLVIKTNIEVYDKDAYSLTYIAAKDSPSGKDTIYIDGNDTMPFVRK